MNTVNFWPILVASVVAFGIGALWYSPILFGKEWMTLNKVTPEDMEKAKAGGMWQSYLTQFVSTLVSFAVLGFLIAATNTLSATDGAFLALIVWLGFSATDAVTGILWERKPFKLVLITSIGTLVCLVVGGAIIGAWR